MKTSNFFKKVSFSLAFGAAILFTSCDNTTRTEQAADDAVIVDDEVADTYDNSEQTFEARRTSLETEIENEINETEREVEQWNKDRENATAEARTEIDRNIEVNEARLENMREHKTRAGEATEENWDEFEREVRTSFDNAGDELERMGNEAERGVNEMEKDASNEIYN